MTRENLHASSRFRPTLRSTDPMAAAIQLLRPQAVSAASLHAAGQWAASFDAFPHVELGVVARGRCWLTMEGHEPLLLEEGDFYLLGNPPPYVLASNLAQRPLDAYSIGAGSARGILRIGSEADEDTYLCGGSFSFNQNDGETLLNVLPQLVHVRAADPRGEQLGHLSALLIVEVESSAAGSSLILDHLSQVLFIQMLRAHVDEADRPTGWLGVLSNDGIGAALRAMHSDLAHRWTLKELADISLMSRSAFAASFKTKVGTPPLEYLIQWRMSLARDALRRESLSISELAFATGYESDSAFSTAFRRVVGISPKQFRDAEKRASTSPYSVA